MQFNFIVDSNKKRPFILDFWYAFLNVSKHSIAHKLRALKNLPLYYHYIDTIVKFGVCKI